MDNILTVIYHVTLAAKGIFLCCRELQIVKPKQTTVTLPLLPENKIQLYNSDTLLISLNQITGKRQTEQEVNAPVLITDNFLNDSSGYYS